MSLKFIILLLSLLASSLATSKHTVQEIFEQHQVVPDVITAPPQQFLQVTYSDNLKAENGVELTPTQVREQPTVTWVPDEANAYYTLIMTDPDAPSRADPKFREFNHWLVGNIPGNRVADGDTIHAYVGSGPPKGTGLHRYVFLLYKQPQRLHFGETTVANNSREDRPKFRAEAFAKKYQLGKAVAGNLYQAQWDEYVPILHQQLSGN